MGDRGRRAFALLPALVVFLLAASLLTARTASAASSDPSLKWHTAQTDHFVVYWYDGEEIIAKRILEICEPVRARVTKAVDYVPKGKTHVVLTDVTDSANGFAITIPYNSIHLFITGPTEGSSLDSYDDWLTMLLTHEFTHICHIGKIGGVPWVMRGLFGTVVSPDEIEPRWIIEGYATYQETQLTAAGRGRSTFADMLLRNAALENRWPSIDRLGGETEEWPSGYLPYIFGVEFLEHLKNTYGEEKVTAFTHATSREPFPFYPFYPRINHSAKKAFGKSFYKLWKEWKQDATEQYTNEKANLEANGLTPIEQLTHFGGTTIAPRISPDGKKIVYAAANGRENASIRTMDIDGKHDKVLISKFFADGFAWSPDGKHIAFGSQKQWKDYYYWNDIYTWSIDDSVLTRMTRGARARTPDYKPDGTELLFVVNDVSNNDLASLKVDQTVRWLTDNRDWTQYSTPRWRPDGKAVAISAWYPGGYRDVAIVGTSGQMITRVTADRFLDRDPSWTPDGKYLLFSSDRSGIPNLYAFDPGTSQYFQVTSVLGGAFQPSVSSDSKWIVFQGYTSRGYDVFRTKFDPSTWKEIGWTFDPEVWDATCTPAPKKDQSRLDRARGEGGIAAAAPPSLDGGEYLPPRPGRAAGFAGGGELPALAGAAHVGVPFSPLRAPFTPQVDALDHPGVPVVDHSVSVARPRMDARDLAALGDEPPAPGSSVSTEKVTGGGIRPSDSPDKNKGIDLSPYKPKKFHPWKTLWPRYWLPAQLYITESGAYVGAFTGGNDPLFRNSWTAYVNYNTAAGYVGGGARYFYDRFKPTFYAGGDAYVLDYGQSVYEYSALGTPGSHILDIHSTGRHYYEQHLSGTAGAYFFWRNRYFVSLFYLFDNRSAFTKLSPLTYEPFIPVKGNFAGPTIALAMDRTEAYRYSISPEKGYRVVLTGQALEPVFGSDFHKDIGTIDARYYIPFKPWPYSVLGLRAVAGVAEGDAIRPSTFRLGGAIGESVFTLATPNYYSLRGFPFFAFGGERLAIGSAEFRFPIWRANRGLGTGPVFLHMLHGSLFADTGTAWQPTTAYADVKWHTGVGAELRLDTVWYYFFPLTIRMGYSFALNNDPAGYKPGDPYGYILTLGTSF